MAEVARERARTAADVPTVVADREREMVGIESIERQAEKDRELKLSELESNKELKVTTEVESEKLKYSFVVLKCSIKSLRIC